MTKIQRSRAGTRWALRSLEKALGEDESPMTGRRSCGFPIAAGQNATRAASRTSVNLDFEMSFSLPRVSLVQPLHRDLLLPNLFAARRDRVQTTINDREVAPGAAIDPAIPHSVGGQDHVLIGTAGK